MCVWRRDLTLYSAFHKLTHSAVHTLMWRQRRRRRSDSSLRQNVNRFSLLAVSIQGVLMKCVCVSDQISNDPTPRVRQDV